jgi:hypothetical protein
MRRVGVYWLTELSTLVIHNWGILGETDRQALMEDLLRRANTPGSQDRSVPGFKVGSNAMFLGYRPCHNDSGSGSPPYYIVLAKQ